MLRFFTAGESHGPALTAIVEGFPAGVAVKPEDIDRDLARRQQGYGRGGRMKIERDQVVDYARRKGWSLETAERWLAPILNYDPRTSEAA